MQSGQVCIEEFILGCKKLRGQAIDQILFRNSFE